VPAAEGVGVVLADTAGQQPAGQQHADFLTLDFHDALADALNLVFRHARLGLADPDAEQHAVRHALGHAIHHAHAIG